MKKMKKIVSLLLTVTLLIGSLATFSVVQVGAASTEEYPEIKVEDEVIDYRTQEFKSAEDKIKSMTLYLDKGNYQFYVDTYSGETATVNKVTGEILLSNPYDIAASKSAESTKNEILSQLIVKFTDQSHNSKVFTSYEYAAMRNQIKVKNIKNGVRIEYTIGREEARILVPRIINATRFETLIFNLVKAGYNEQFGEGSGDADFWITKFEGSYQKYSIEGLTGRQKSEILALYPICEKMDIYVCDINATETELNRLEEVIKTFCPEYSFDELDADHEETGYVAEDMNPPVFKMALEYTLDESGVSVRLPTNGIRYDESLYQIDHISVLPYMGAGHNNNTGYTFFPDGSGAIFNFEDMDPMTQTMISGKVYGTDFAYHEISGTYQKQVTVPVFGLVENQTLYKVLGDPELGDFIISGTVADYDKLVKKYDSVTEIKRDAGFFAIIEDGESLSTITSCHEGAVSEYHHVTMTFNPRPKDEYKLADSISVVQDANSTLTVVSDRKYTGDFKVKYVLLTDDKIATESKLPSYYECSYVGMANAYRDYLAAKGIIDPLTSSKKGVTGDIPLYLEVFGAIETTEQILSMPVDVMTPLTTFDDVKKMYEDLSKNEGIKNINFKMTGFMNGGLMNGTAPYRLKWERNVGGSSGFKDLVKYASNFKGDENLGLYPDVDFAYVQGTKMFDGLSYKKHAVRTIDDRYSQKRAYSATMQKYISFWELAVSPAYYSHFYEKFMKSYNKYNAPGISLGSIGSNLNSDFDEDEPFNREDNKQYTIEAFDYISKQVDSVMTDKGNIYTWKFVDHILNLALDSSRYTKASASVPFLGIVLHSYKQFAGEPLNMEGDMHYALLKAIENGSGVFFILSAQNTEELKDFYQFNTYYSINYENWKKSMVETYNKLNVVLKDVQLKPIISHEFLEGTRVLDTDEIDQMVRDEILANKEYQDNLDAILELEKLTTVSNARKASKAAEGLVIAYLKRAQDELDNAKKYIESKIPKQIDKIEYAKFEYELVLEENKGNEEAEEVIIAKYMYESAIKSFTNMVTSAILTNIKAKEALEDALATCETADLAITIVKNAENTLDTMIEEAERNAAAARSHIADIEKIVDETLVYANKAYELSAKFISKEDIKNRIDQILSSGNKDKDEEDEEEIDPKYVSDKSKLVAVTYGSDNKPFKTFILNYNSYSVIVEFNGVVYSIASGDFVTINY